MVMTSARPSRAWLKRPAIVDYGVPIVGVGITVFIARWLVYPHAALGEIARVPLVVVAGQSLAYLLILAYMYILVTRERRRPDFLAAIHWNWPSYRVHILKLPIPVVDLFLLAGFGSRKSVDQLADQQSEWDDTWLCARCGHKWQG